MARASKLYNFAPPLTHYFHPPSQKVFFDLKSYIFALPNGELAQLARALAWHARGHRFDSGILHIIPVRIPCFSKSLLIFWFKHGLNILTFFLLHTKNYYAIGLTSRGSAVRPRQLPLNSQAVVNIS